MKIYKFEKFNESESNDIDWNDVESKWDLWYEESNGEADYDDEYGAMKSFVKGDVDWKSVKSEYFDYIEETNNEDDYDSKFRKFKSFVKKNLNNKFIKESFELEGDFLNDCYLELSDLGFEFKISSNSISGELNGKYKFDEVIDLYRDFILRIEFEFHVKEHNISFKENGVEIEVNLIEKTLEGLKDSIKIKLDGEEKICKITGLRRSMINVSKKTYLSGLQFEIETASTKGFIRFWINWELNWKDVKNNAKKYNKIFINPELYLRGFQGRVEIDKESANKLYQYFVEKGGGWKYGQNDDYTKVDFTEQCSSDDLVGSWNL